MAMCSPHLRGRVLPVLIAETPDWKESHSDIHKLQKFDYYRDPAEVETRLIEQEFNRPRHKLGWTKYFHTRLTNQERHYVLPDGQSIALKYGHDLDDFLESGLSNPLATNNHATSQE